MPTTTRRPRADARRNRDRLLTAADELFRERGADASLEAVAKLAGVAIGTLYGHFPTRRALIGAVLQDRNDALIEAGHALAGLPPEEALRRWVALSVAHATTYRGLTVHLLEGAEDGETDETSGLYRDCGRMSTVNERVTHAAVESGAIRPGTTGADVQTLVSACAMVGERVTPEQADRFLAIALRGLLSR
ncbi:TetR/AcrR family transcriptional regulator [Actinokineospora inagensis]|uniref:TetR/AcrR family transcriptional regulator n=1 Tax=Actinokineospora inagensis TaxID=103730 RepID=UPI0004010594|nr:TetR/AcrR family transcriptional regulator [Actinokineospora inagensis]